MSFAPPYDVSWEKRVMEDMMSLWMLCENGKNRALCLVWYVVFVMKISQNVRDVQADKMCSQDQVHCSTAVRKRRGCQVCMDWRVWCDWQRWDEEAAEGIMQIYGQLKYAIMAVAECCGRRRGWSTCMHEKGGGWGVPSHDACALPCQS